VQPQQPDVRAEQLSIAGQYYEKSIQHVSLSMVNCFSWFSACHLLLLLLLLPD
jgi:hypothetical protein